MGSALPVARISVEEYLAADDIAERPSEYFGGEVSPIVDATFAHGALAVSMGAALRNRLQQTVCTPSVGVRVRVTDEHYVYPDLSLFCGQPVTAKVRQSETYTNPKVVIEILSPSTANFDYGVKFALYRQVESLDIAIPLAELYEGIEFPTAARYTES
ncbi:MAG: Uma2 family endonuclease [Bryobacterales bacterium]|nr:Uma2 family endonuclease [Bryobacterales bacterium]